MISRLVERFGRTGFAALTSLGWALPMAAWAGSADLSPIDQTAYPRVAFTIGAVMFAAWLVMIWLARRIDVTARPHRFELGQMSALEKRWTVALAVCATCAIGWLNGAATVDWTPLLAAVATGKAAPIAFAAGLALFMCAALAGIAVSWRKSSLAFALRAASSSLSNVR